MLVSEKVFNNFWKEIDEGKETMRQFQNKETLEFHDLTGEMFVRFFENRDPAMFREVSEHEQEYNKLFTRLSGHFLCAHLPEDFFTYEDEDQMQFIEDSAWEPLEHNSPEDVYNLIDSLTYDVQLIMKKGL
jgi:hypothetical protein